MKKEFNITGICIPDLHYMMDNNRQIEKVMELIVRGKYFTISRPRQYGKTTTLQCLSEGFQESKDYFPIALNFQGTDTE
ncbi:MAG: hypothetical protein AAGG68_03885 [Bacteroidota bacterium]